MKKTAALIIFLFFCRAADAGVFDIMEGALDPLQYDFGAKKTNQIEMKINGRNLEAARYESNSDAEDIIGYYFGLAQKKKYNVIDNAGIDSMANFFINSGRKTPVYDYDYVFYEDEKENGTLIAAVNDEEKAEVVRVKIKGSINTGRVKGFDDGVAHFPGAEKVLSVEMLSSGKTAGFGNFYRVAYSGNAIKDYYNDFFKKHGWEILYEKEEKDSVSYMIRKGEKQYLFNIYYSGGEQWVTIIG
jgi:hypothetical protein